MSEKIEASLQKAIFEVFETMFFLCPDDVYFTESSAEEKSEEICVKIESLGKFNFCLWLAYSESLLKSNNAHPDGLSTRALVAPAVISGL